MLLALAAALCMSSANECVNPQQKGFLNKDKGCGINAQGCLFGNKTEEADCQYTSCVDDVYTFSMFYLEDSENCKFDRFSYSDENTSLILCGNAAPQSILVKEGSTIMYNTDETDTFPGFVLCPQNSGIGDDNVIIESTQAAQIQTTKLPSHFATNVSTVSAPTSAARSVNKPQKGKSNDTATKPSTDDDEGMTTATILIIVFVSAAFLAIVWVLVNTTQKIVLTGPKSTRIDNQNQREVLIVKQIGGLFI